MSKSSISLSSIDSKLLDTISRSRSSNSDSINKNQINKNQITNISSNESILEIKELNLELINPNTKNYNIDSQGGSKLVIIGKPGTGKSTLIASILYEKKGIIPVGKFVSGTEDSNNFYKEIAPSLFISNIYEEEDVEKFIKRQKLAKKHIENPWAVLLLDDCTDKPALFKRPLQQNLYKNGRHYKMLYIVSLQYCMDVLPSIRTNVDGVFILRETNLKNRHSLYENYAGIIPDFNIFCQIMDQITNDYTALYIHNSTTTNDWKDCIFWYKADMSKIKNWKFGCPDYWKFAKNRFDPNYTDTI
jgi:hypothetical protein